MWVLRLCTAVSIFVTLAIVVSLAEETRQFFNQYSVGKFLTGTTWNPVGDRGGEYGVWPLVGGSLMIAGGSLVVGLPLGLASAVYLSEYAPARVRAVVKPLLELLAGIPTVVVGFFALQVITPNVLRPLFGKERVFIFNAAAGALAVGVIVLPIIATVCEDALRAVPRSLREASYSLGGSKRVTSLRVLLPAAASGISAATILAVSRAVGETMAVNIAAGNTPALTTNFFSSIQTLTAYIAQTVGGETAAGSLRNQSLYAVGALLFVMTLALNLLSARLVRRFNR